MVASWTLKADLNLATPLVWFLMAAPNLLALADQLHVSRQTVNAIETGKYDPGLPLAFKIARLFSQQIEEIFDPGD